MPTMMLTMMMAMKGTMTANGKETGRLPRTWKDSWQEVAKENGKWAFGNQVDDNDDDHFGDRASVMLVAYPIPTWHFPWKWNKANFGGIEESIRGEDECMKMIKMRVNGKERETGQYLETPWRNMIDHLLETQLGDKCFSTRQDHCDGKVVYCGSYLRAGYDVKAPRNCPDGLHKLCHPAIPDWRTWRIYGDHGKERKHQLDDDLKHR